MDAGYQEALRRIMEAKENGDERLELSELGLTQLPAEIGQLSELRKLYLEDNQLTTLPVELGQLENLRRLYLDGNPLTDIPVEIRKEGVEAIRCFLKATDTSSQPQWHRKLLLVGDANAGKTSLLNVLQGNPFNPQQHTTRGFEIHSLDLADSQDDGEVMHFNVWDFGGQDRYHAIHQYFLSGNPLVILVWNAFLGWQPLELERWLVQITAKTIKAPILVVATHIDRLPVGLSIESLTGTLPNILGYYGVSNVDGEGIDDLRQAIIKTAQERIPKVQVWPTPWKHVVTTIRQSQEKYISSGTFYKLLQQYKVDEDHLLIVTTFLHNLSDILFFTEEDELKKWAIFDLQWLMSFIYKIIDDKVVFQSQGVLSKQRLDELWFDLDVDMQPYCYRLMEYLGLVYCIPSDEQSNHLVVESLPLDPKDGLESKWVTIVKNNPKKVEIIFRLNTLPAGIPTRFIARNYPLMIDKPWRRGALLADNRDTPRHYALVKVFHENNEVHLSVHGTKPNELFTWLKGELEYSFNHFSGLEVECYMPCPGANGQTCFHQLKYEHLTKVLYQKRPIIKCPSCFTDIAAPELIFGFDPRLKMGDDEFSEKQQEVNAFIDAVNMLYQEIASWVGAYGLSVTAKDIVIAEDGVEPYRVPEMTIMDKDQKMIFVTLKPIGSSVVAANGCIDFDGSIDKEHIYLQKKGGPIFQSITTSDTEDLVGNNIKHLYKGISQDGWFWFEHKIPDRGHHFNNALFHKLLMMVSSDE